MQHCSSSKMPIRDFLGDSEVRICLPKQETEVYPWFEKISHATGQQSPWATTTEPVLQILQPTTTEALMPQNPCQAAIETITIRSLCTATKSNPCSSKVEKSYCSNEDPAQPKTYRSETKDVNQNNEVTPHTSKWLASRKLTNRNVSQFVQKRKPFYTVNANVNQCSR